MEEKRTLRPSPTALLNPRLDVNFKAIFTQETKESYTALQSFLSSALNRNIEKLSLTTNEPPVDTPSQMQMSFDVAVTFEDGEKASIEMQGRDREYNYSVRSEIQVARLLNNNAKKGSNWSAEKVYQISVLNFHPLNDDKYEVAWYNMRNQNGQELAGYLNVIFIDLLEIKKLIGTPVEKLTPIQKWGLFLSYADDETQSKYIRNLSKSEKGIMEAELIIGHMSEEESNWFRQNSIDTFWRDLNSEREAVLERGIQQGIKQGEHQKSLDAAKNLYKNGVSVEIIAKSLNIPLEEVQNIVS